MTTQHRTHGVENLVMIAGALLFALSIPVQSQTNQDPDWQPVPDRMMTRWGKAVTPENAWQEYPRPLLQRDQWVNLNGLWEYSLTSSDASQPTNWEGQILVPYALESALSGVGRELQPDQALWYRRSIQIPAQTAGRVLLNFEACDYETTVSVNGSEVGGHVGGNTPFQLDITSAVRPGENEIVVRVEDATGGFQLRGKQTLKPEGIWYTRVSGIWQTVWLEVVPEQHLADLSIQTSLSKGGTVTVTPVIAGDRNGLSTTRVTVLDKGRKVATGLGGEAIVIPDAKLWSPSSPHLYDLEVELINADGAVVDSARSYAGVREVGRRQDADGHWRFTLNGEDIFHWGPLDQGWWPDGLLTPPSDAGMRSDIEFLKQAGFNMIRKHIKVEPRRYYQHCDEIGIMLWQDQPSGGPSPKWTRMARNPKDADWPEAEHQQYMAELKEMMDSLRSHPSIVVWVPFNEAWGQHRSMEVGTWTSQYDPSRLVNIASGGNFWPIGDMADHHEYPQPAFPLQQNRFDPFIKVVGEFGGHGWPVKGHLWNEEMRNWGYGGLPKTIEEWEQRYSHSIDVLAGLKSRGIAAGVYTQTTDVEGEINGLLTYDREVQKASPEKLASWSEALFAN